MAKKEVVEEVVEKIVTEEVVEKIVTEEVVEEKQVISQEEVAQQVLKSDWEESLIAQLASVDSSHIEKGAIKAIINGLIS